MSARQYRATFFLLPRLRRQYVATLPWRGRVGLPKAVRGGVMARQQMTATHYMRKRCHPLPARWRGPTSPLQGEVKVAP